MKRLKASHVSRISVLFASAGAHILFLWGWLDIESKTVAVTEKTAEYFPVTFYAEKPHSVVPAPAFSESQSTRSSRETPQSENSAAQKGKAVAKRRAEHAGARSPKGVTKPGTEYTGDSAGRSKGSLAMRRENPVFAMSETFKNQLGTDSPAQSSAVKTNLQKHPPSNPRFFTNITEDGNISFTAKPNASFTKPTKVMPNPSLTWLPNPAEAGTLGKGPTVQMFEVAQFDATDALMAKLGQDPYLHKKLQIMDDTRDQRIEMARKVSHRRANQTLMTVPALISQIVASSWPLAQKHSTLFQLWDECAETGDAQTIAMGQAIRKIILARIRSDFPADSKLAYSADEIAMFNARKESSARFTPYP